MCIFKFLFFTNVKLQKKQLFSFHYFFFQDYSFNGVGRSGADISFIEVEEERAGEVEGSILVLDSGDGWK